MDFTNLADLNLTDLQKFSANTIFRKVTPAPFAGSPFVTNPQVFTENFVRNLISCGANGVNAAVAAAQVIDESAWGRSGVLMGIKAGLADKAAGNVTFRPTHETVSLSQKLIYQSQGDLIEVVSILPDGLYDILIKDWFFYANTAVDVPTFIARNFQRYYAFMNARAAAHGFDLSVVSKSIEDFLNFLEDAKPAKGLYAYASGEGYKTAINQIISDNGLESFVS